MALGSFVHGALAELSLDDLARMLELDETLFVEHKSDVHPDHAYNLASAVASFANTLGGWLLLGVRDGKPIAEPGSWFDPSGPPLVDVVRDRLRMEIDPLPAFEARVMTHSDGPVGVVRVYESSDTPHVSIRSGSVFVREVAGTSDAAHPKRPGGGLRGDRAYGAAQIRSRAQLLELADRGRRASERVKQLVDPRQPLPLVSSALDVYFEQAADGSVRPRSLNHGAIVIRLVPYTLPPRFQGWATTATASAAVLRAAEELSDVRGLAPGWLTPHPSGASLEIGLRNARHHDAAGGSLAGTAKVVIDGAGVAGAALHLTAPNKFERRAWWSMHDISEGLIEPVIAAATTMLGAADIVGRCWCQIDLIGLAAVLLLEGQGNREAADWVPTSDDLAMPVDGDALQAAGRRAVYAYARGAGVPAWDPPAGAA
jgi:Putative DNA-binding domain